MVWIGFGTCSLPAESPFFGIHVVDESTGRGVPLVELDTVNSIPSITDSAGWIAYNEPGLMNQRVFFTVRSHGYQFHEDGFGYRGVALVPKPGGRVEIKIKRINIAERLYRITGQGIYRDSILLGEPVPIQEPLLNGQVLGQDSVMAAPYRGKIYWFWGDTLRASYPLGHFATAGAVSEAPGHGGLEPAVGINLAYFVGSNGFSRPMCPIHGEGPVWIDGMATVTGENGRERLVTRYMRVKDLGHPLEHGLAVYNDEKELFEKAVEFDLKDDIHCPREHPVRVKDAEGDYLYFSSGCLSGPLAKRKSSEDRRGFFVARVRADLSQVKNPKNYEVFSCLKDATFSKTGLPKVVRDASGKLVYTWRQLADPLDAELERELIAAGQIHEDEARFQIKDMEAKKAIHLAPGSINWNPFRKKWVMIAGELGGTSYDGEIWYSEADAITGPWRWARKVVTHEKYTFYNPTQHPFFDQEGGRIIYFEATYTNQFSGNPAKTPRYDYNQILYRLDLSDERLSMGK